jgi:DNA invertase Pin-like site-specific DNA recombinase
MVSFNKSARPQTLIPDRFDDGAFFGAFLDRPALQTLMEAARAEKIDIIVVYTVDRLARSPADLAKLVELFDSHDISFVSVAILVRESSRIIFV